MSDNLRNYSIEEVAGILGCYVGYLRDNLSRLPHQKIGIAVAFDEDEIRQIKDMHRVRHGEQLGEKPEQHPKPGPQPARPAPSPQPVPSSLSSLRPTQKHRRRSAS